MNDEYFYKLSEFKSSHIPCVSVTIVNMKGSAPQNVGAKIIVGTTGLLFGTIGGGKVEALAIDHAIKILANKSTFDFVEWNLQKDVGMTCGGVIKLFFEKIQIIPEWKIAVFGAGHVAQELIQLLLKLDCEITCIDPRIEWLDKIPNSNKIKKIKIDDMSLILKDLNPDSFIVSVTMGHDFDLIVAKVALEKFNFPYVGAIGSETKSRILKSDLEKSGLSTTAVEKLKCPIGEKIGNNSPAEIAISIVAQLLRVRDNLNGNV
jgi:xanthine dehydrogenase accessory factor